MPDVKTELQGLQEKIERLRDDILAPDHPVPYPQPNETPAPGYRPNYLYQEGECLRLSVACVTGLRTEELPYIGPKDMARKYGPLDGNKGFWLEWLTALSKLGYMIMPLNGRPSETDEVKGIDGFWIAGVPGENRAPTDINHAVVMKDGRVHYDPNPGRGNLEGKTVDEAKVGYQVWLWEKGTI